MLASKYDQNIEGDKQEIMQEAEKFVDSHNLTQDEYGSFKIKYLEQLNEKLNVCEFIGDEADFWDFCDRHILDLSTQLDHLIQKLSDK